MVTRNERKIRSGASSGARSPIKRSEFQIPDNGGAINIEYRDMSADLSWPTELGPHDALTLLRRIMEIGSNSVYLFFIGADQPDPRPLRQLRNLDEFDLGRLESANLDDQDTGDGVFWQQYSDEPKQVNRTAGIRAVKFDGKVLREAFFATGDQVLKKHVDEMTLQAISITAGITDSHQPSQT